MSVVLSPDYEIVQNHPDYSGRVSILGICYADTESDLPSADYFSVFTLSCGFRGVAADTGKEYMIDSSGVWHVVDKSPFSDVYTKSETYSKTEVDNITDAIIAAYRNADETIWKYIYELLLVSDLNLCSVHSGSSSGYFVQDLPVSLPPGDYIWKFKRDGSTQTSMRVKAADDTSLYNVTRGSGVNDFEQPFTISDTGAKLSIYTGSGINITYCAIYKAIE